MRVGLIRHFQVLEPMPRGWVTMDELLAWRTRYDSAEVSPVPLSLEGGNWARCYASDLPRAQKTAQAVYSGEISPLSELREVEFAPFQSGRLRLPFRLWTWLVRLAWMTGHESQRRLRDDFFGRMRRVADLIEAQKEDHLMVSHAGMMFYLRKELLSRGFFGPKFGIAENARLYVFERGRV